MSKTPNGFAISGRRQRDRMRIRKRSRTASAKGGAGWHLADLVLEFRIADGTRTLVHINTVLLHATSHERAYSAAMKLGRAQEQTYCNTDGKRVHVAFRGLRELTYLDEPLEHGSELAYTERIGLTKTQISRLVRSKRQLAVFRPRQITRGPNYMPAEVAKMLQDAGVVLPRRLTPGRGKRPV